MKDFRRFCPCVSTQRANIHETFRGVCTVCVGEAASGHRAMVLVDSPGVDGPDGPAILPVADDTDGAAEVPLLPPPEVPPESSSPSMLRNPAAERQLSPSKARLTQRAAEWRSPFGGEPGGLTP